MASSLFLLITTVLGILTVLFIVFAKLIMSLFAPGFDDNPALRDLTVNLSRLLFLIVLLPALTGVVVGMLNSFEHLQRAGVGAGGVERGDHRGARRADPRAVEDADEIYAYAIGVLVGSLVQFLLPLPGSAVAAAASPSPCCGATSTSGACSS